MQLVSNKTRLKNKLDTLSSYPNRKVPIDLEKAYRAKVTSEHFQLDTEQLRLLQALQQLSNELINTECDTLICNVMSVFTRHISIKGLYIVGGVGRGKTFLMDLFFQHLPIKNKQRLHFQVFLQKVHEGLAEFSDSVDPLLKVAEQFAKQTRVLCLDEIVVNDVVDAMILVELLPALRKKGVSLVMTSNTRPKDLYKNGLQRSRFLTAIDVIERHMNVIVLKSDQDYRRLVKHVSYIRSAGELSEQRLKRMFSEWVRVDDKWIRTTPININQRLIPVKSHTNTVIWFDFVDLCQSKRSTLDYQQIAHRFSTIFVSNVPVMHDGSNDIARRFINMIDVFYDNQVRLVFSTQAEPDALYQGDRLAAEFKRTASRLVEMQQPVKAVLAS